MKRTLFKCKDNLNKKFPLQSAHQWYESGHDAVKDAMTEHLNITEFDSFGVIVSMNDSAKRKELLIAYNELNEFLVCVLPKIVASSKVEQGLIDDSITSLNELVNAISAFDIEHIEVGDPVPVSAKTNKLTQEQMQYVLTYNTVILDMKTRHMIRHYSIENQRIKNLLEPEYHPY